MSLFSITQNIILYFEVGGDRGGCNILLTSAGFKWVTCLLLNDVAVIFAAQTENSWFGFKQEEWNVIIHPIVRLVVT